MHVSFDLTYIYVDHTSLNHHQLAQSLTTGDDSPFGGPSSHSGHSSLYAAEAGMARHASSSSKSNPASTDALNEEETALAADINRTISQMTDLIERRMKPCAERTGKSQHTLLVKRYREILFDCSADFKKTSAAVARKREQAELFRGANTGGSGSGNGMGGGGGENGRDEGMEHLLRERNAIGNSMKAADAVLGQATEVQSELRSQGASLRGVQGTLLTIAGNVPGLNVLIDKIRKKRNLDDTIVSGVIAACILFTLWYVLG